MTGHTSSLNKEALSNTAAKNCPSLRIKYSERLWKAIRTVSINSRMMNIASIAVLSLMDPEARR